MSWFFQCEVQWWITNLSRTKGRSALMLIFVMLNGHKVCLVWWKSLFSRPWSRSSGYIPVLQSHRHQTLTVFKSCSTEAPKTYFHSQLPSLPHLLTHHICTVTPLRELQGHHRCWWTGIPELMGTRNKQTYTWSSGYTYRKENVTVSFLL